MLSFIYLLFTNSESEWIPSEVNQAAYENLKITDLGFGFKLTGTRRSDRAALVIEVGNVGDKGYPRKIISARRPAPEDQQSPSTFPLGIDRRLFADDKALTFIVVGHSEKVTIRVNGPLIKEPASEGFGYTRRFKDVGLLSERDKVEAWARHILSSFADRRLVPISNIQAHGQTVHAARSSKDEIVFVPLREWSVARGVGLHWNAEAKRGTIGNAMFFLGDSRMKIGSEYKEMGDIPILRNGQIWMPLQALDSI